VPIDALHQLDAATHAIGAEAIDGIGIGGQG
jgi:hypothetical protein